MLDQPEAPEDFTWLHLTDLHAGMQSQNWLWPNLKQLLFDDLTKLVARLGRIDTVIFSGDLTQRGSKKEFAVLDTILSEMWSVFNGLGFSPSIFVLPGNHDVTRAAKLKPELQVLKKWWEIPDVHEEFFGDENNVYRRSTDELLEEYQNWVEKLSKSGIPMLETTAGILPGDQAAVIKKGNLKIGLIGLNSTWLQLDGDEYHGKLHVDARQLQRVTNESPANWCETNDCNLLVTHHPVDWLHKDSQSFWDSDINPPGRFDAHLYGHMHQPTSRGVSVGGSLIQLQ
jgi:predicted MPP superfamily phosphohydrolase